MTETETELITIRRCDDSSGRPHSTTVFADKVYGCESFLKAIDSGRLVGILAFDGRCGRIEIQAVSA